MSLSYEPLWQMLNNLNITKMEFAKMINISNATLAKIGKNEPITLTTVDKICNRFNCQIEDVVKHIQDIQISQQNFAINIGTIILANNVSQIEDQLYRTCKRPYLILQTAYTKGEEGEFAVAPIYTPRISPKPNPLNVFFYDVELDGKITNGYVSLKKISVMSSGKFEKILGIMPEKYMEDINQILQST